MAEVLEGKKEQPNVVLDCKCAIISTGKKQNKTKTNQNSSCCPNKCCLLIISGKSFSSHTLKADIPINKDPAAKLLYVEVTLNNVNFL